MSVTMPGLLPDLHVSFSSACAGLQIFGLRTTQHSPLSYITLDEALQNKWIEVTEVSEGGSVPTLKVVNLSAHRVFLMAGEQLLGARQNRVLNTSLLLEAHTTVPIPVSCVEQRRWSYRSATFSSAETQSNSVLRKKMTDSVTRSYETLSLPRSNQGEVWDEVTRTLSAHGSLSETMAMEKVYEDTRERLSEVLSQCRLPGGCQGAVFVLHGKIAGVDLFDASETLTKLWPKLVRGYAIDALERPTEGLVLSAAEVEHWLERAAQAEATAFPSPGPGEDIRLKNAELTGAMLLVDEVAVHTQLFARV